MNTLNKTEEEKMREAFIKTGMWPNEVMYANWCRAWKESAVYANTQHSKILEDYDRIARVAEKQADEIAELKMELDCYKNRVCCEIETLRSAGSDLLNKINQNIPIAEIEKAEKVLKDALSNTQAAADAFMAEHDARMLEEAKKQWWKDLHYAEPEILEVMRQCEEDEIKFSKVSAWGALVDAAKKASTRAKG